MNIFKKIAITLTTFSLVFVPALASANEGKDKGDTKVRAKIEASLKSDHDRPFAKFFNKFGNSLPKVAEMKHEVEGGLLPGLRSFVKTTTTVEIKAMLLSVEKAWKTYRASVGAAVKVERASKHTARANFKVALKTAIANRDKGAVIGAFETFFSVDTAAEATFNEARTAARAKFIVDLKATL